MTPKETAIATVETFSKLLGCKVDILDEWETYSFINATAYYYQERYEIYADSFKDSPDTIDVRVRELGDDAKREFVLIVGNVSPELAAKFTREAINAYERELAE